MPAKRIRDPADFRARTDLGNAERLRDRHGALIRYCEDRQEWRSWSSPVWCRNDSGPVYRFAAETARSIVAEARQLSDEQTRSRAGSLQPSDRMRMLSHAEASESKRAQEAMIGLAAHMRPISCKADVFDRDPWLLNTPTGIVDLRSDGGISFPDPAALLTRVTRASVGETSAAPTWLRFLDEITCGDAELRDYLQRAIGMSLVGIQRDHVFMFLYGSGRNGKGTFLNALLHAIGDYGMTLPPDILIEKKFESHPTELADLEGCRIAVGSEVPKGKAWDQVRIKALSGGDRIRARRMRQDFVEFSASHTFWISGNDQPRVDSQDNGIWRRMRLVPFRADIPKEAENPDLAVMLEAERDGILAWALDGCRLYLERGLGSCAAVADATEEYKRNEDLVGEFLADCCTLGDGFRADKHAMRDALREWLEERDYRPIRDKSLKMDFARRGITETRSHRGAREWVGVGLVSTHTSSGREY